MNKYRRLANEYCEKWVGDTGRSFRNRFLSGAVAEYMNKLGKSLIEFTDAEILELLIDHLKLRKMSTIDNYINSYSKFFDWLIKNGVVSSNPCDSPLFDQNVIASALSKVDAEVYSPEEIEQIIASLGCNREYVSAFIRLAYEGCVRKVRDIAMLKASDWDGRILRVGESEFTPSDKLRIALNGVSSITRRDGMNGKNYKMQFDGTHLFPNAIREYNEAAYPKQFNQNVRLMLNIAEEETGRSIDCSTLYYSGMMWRLVDKMGKDKFVAAMLGTGQKELAEALAALGYNERRIDYIKYRYKFFALRLK